MKLAETPLAEIATGVQGIFGVGLVGLYLHGSAALGCYGPHSDVDVVVALARPSSAGERRRLAELCLAVSQATWDESHCLLELDAVVVPHLRPWRYPPPLDFHYGESLREAFERGDPKPWRVDASSDLAAVLTVVRAAGIALLGPPPVDVFPEVPRADYREAIAADLPWCLEHLEDRRLYAVLNLPRIWAGLTTEDVHSKATAADWALPRLPPELRPVLGHAHAVYRGEAEESWTGLPVDEYVAWVVEQIPS